MRFHAAFEEGWDHVAGPRVRTGVLLCEQGAQSKKCKVATCNDFKKKWKCMKTCGLCEACEDNTIPGFGGATDTSWCKLNTLPYAKTDAASARFCAGDHGAGAGDYGRKCKKSCGLCK